MHAIYLIAAIVVVLAILWAIAACIVGKRPDPEHLGHWPDDFQPKKDDK